MTRKKRRWRIEEKRREREREYRQAAEYMSGNTSPTFSSPSLFSVTVSSLISQR